MKLDIPYRSELCEEYSLCFNLFHQHPDGILIIKDDKIIDCNDAAIKLFGYKLKDEIVDSTIYDLSPFTQDDGQSSKKLIQEIIEESIKTGYKRFEWVNKKNSGKRFYSEIILVARKVKNETLVSAIVKDITLNKDNENKINFLLSKDTLTKLDNKESLRIRIEKKLFSKESNSSHKKGLLFLDINKFKSINDNLGHGIGDKTLEKFGNRLIQFSNDTNIIGRYSGDEFVVFVNNIKSNDELLSIAQSILDTFKKPFIIDKHIFYLSATIGISNYPQHGKDFDSLIKTADIAMYNAKHGKEESIKIYCDKLQENIREKFLLDSYLKSALNKDELYLHYQPIVDADTEIMIGVEALIRWENKKLGFVPPDKFIPIAENNGTIIPIGEWVLRTACKELKRWHNKGHSNLFMSVNVSIKQLEQVFFSNIVEEILNDLDLDPKHLILEVTETVYMENLNKIYQNLSVLKELGINISIDDFGTGYSSLSQLRKLKISKLKIDRSFIKDIHIDVNSTKIVSAIIAMAKSLNLQIVAEGVEYKEHLEFLKKEKCDMIQGYFFSRPVSSKEIEKMLDGN